MYTISSDLGGGCPPLGQNYVLCVAKISSYVLCVAKISSYVLCVAKFSQLCVRKWEISCKIAQKSSIFVKISDRKHLFSQFCSEKWLFSQILQKIVDFQNILSMWPLPKIFCPWAAPPSAVCPSLLLCAMCKSSPAMCSHWEFAQSGITTEWIYIKLT